MKAEKILVFPIASDSDGTGSRSYGKRWKHAGLFDAGYVVVPSVFLRIYATLKPYPLTLAEAMLVIHLMEFKWDAKDPYPSYKTLSLRMGVSDKRVRRLAQSLEGKGYLKRKLRMATTNHFDLNPLFDALMVAMESEVLKTQELKP